MIFSKVGNLKKYSELSDLFFLIFEFIGRHDMKSINCGRYDLGNGNYVNIVEGKYGTCDNILESHKKYTDVQYVITGSECLLVSDIEDCVKTTEYDKKDDYILYRCERPSEINVGEGYAAVLFPEDAHKMFLKDKDGCSKKAIFKILVD